MANRTSVLGLFKDPGRAASAIKALKGSNWGLDRVHSPFPEHQIMEALGLKKSRVGYFTLAGGLFGEVGGPEYPVVGLEARDDFLLPPDVVAHRYA